MPEKNKTGLHTFTGVNRVRLIIGGKEYFDLLLSLINAAEESIHLQYYIFNDDETGELVVNALKSAAARKVHVYVMADGYASQFLSKSFIHNMTEHGINFRLFEPVFKSRHFYFGRRMHHKIAVVDARYAVAGGINIANRYNDMPDEPAWLDFALFAEGEIAKDLCILCWKTWNGYPGRMPLTPCEIKQISFSIPLIERNEVRMRRNDWVRRKNEISATYIQMLLSARSQIVVLCSYFLPGKIIRKQMVAAVKRGVTIKVITGGFSDVNLAKNAERWLYDWLLRNGIELYEYQKNILHGKIAVCDDKWMTAGSYNINDISAYASIELNLDVRNAKFAADVRAVLEGIITKDCIRVTPEQQLKTRNIFTRLVRWSSYQFIRVVFHLFTFYFKRER